MSRFLGKLAGWLWKGVVSAEPADGATCLYDATENVWEIRETAPVGTAPSTAYYLVGTAQAGLSAEIAVGTAPGGELGGTWASPTVDATHSGSAHHAQSHNHTPTLATRAVAVNTAYQPSATQDVLVYVSVQIDTGAAGDGKIEAMVDSANPPTTVQMTFRVGTALTIIGAELVFLVKAGNYYRLTTTDTAGTPTFTVVGSAHEIRL